MRNVEHRTVGGDEPEQRLDRWFRKHFPHVPQGRIERMCRKGEIRVDGGRVKAATRIVPGQIVRVPPLPAVDAPPPHEMSPEMASGAPDGPDREAAREIQDAVLWQDDDIIVLNKPPGLAVQGGTRQRVHLGALLPALRFGRSDDPRLIHRLDKDTSGLLVLARTAVAASKLGALFRSRDVERIYLAAVAGRPDPQAGTIQYGLVKSGAAGHERVHTIHPDEVAATKGARNAVTDYRVLDQAGTRLAAVVLRPVTGRTHQLRVHMAAIGCPIAGDGKYGGRGQENLGEGWGAGLGGALSRKLHLHAARLRFAHPRTGKAMRFDAPLPEHMLRTWELMGWPVELAEDPLPRLR